MRDLALLLGPALRMAQAGGKSVGKGATHLRVGRGQAAAPIGEPHASRFAETDSHGKTGRRIKRARCQGAKHWDQLEDLPKSETQRPPADCAASDGPGELTERRWRPCHVVAGTGHQGSSAAILDA